ncbi:MAG: hypothetical protein VYC13_06335 [Actinomycetota bacterium]|nr:hypothetical protein [Actinomycetota bacterium]
MTVGLPRRAVALAGFVVVLAVGVVLATSGPDEPATWVDGRPPSRVEARLVVDAAPVRTIDPYGGLGTWVDAYDFDPAYVPGAVTVRPVDVVDMADHGVRTLYLQSSRSDSRATGLVADPWLMAGFLLAGDRADVDVVAWYLPKWRDDDEDLDRLLAVDRFSVLGRRFAGLAVDIEWNRDDLGAIERSDRLVDLTDRLRRTVGGDPLAAIVMPPIITDQINLAFWPGFPWDELADRYDVWMTMGYWSFRTEEHADPAFYTAENIRRVRANLDQPDAMVHGIGGIGSADGTAIVDPGEPLATIDDLRPFVAALLDERAVGGSIYDWATTGTQARRLLADLMVDFPEASTAR